MRNLWKLTLACLALAMTLPAHAKTPFDKYLYPEEYEVRLALSAAPPAVSEKATVWVMDQAGYRIVREGSNGFNCLVMRGWGGFVDDSAEFFDEKIKAPICFSPTASETVMPAVFFKTKLVLEGKSAKAINTALAEEYYRGRLLAPATVALAYMMSAGQWLGPEVGHFHPHLMLFSPGLSVRELGAVDWATPGPIMGQLSGAPNALVAVPMPNFVPFDGVAGH